MTDNTRTERRKGPKDRRTASSDRRGNDRVVDSDSRRKIPDRRNKD